MIIRTVILVLPELAAAFRILLWLEGDLIWKLRYKMALVILKSLVTFLFPKRQWHNIIFEIKTCSIRHFTFLSFSVYCEETSQIRHKMIFLQYLNNLVCKYLINIKHFCLSEAYHVDKHQHISFGLPNLLTFYLHFQSSPRQDSLRLLAILQKFLIYILGLI